MRFSGKCDFSSRKYHHFKRQLFLSIWKYPTNTGQAVLEQNSTCRIKEAILFSLKSYLPLGLKILWWLNKFLNSFAVDERNRSCDNSMSILNRNRSAKTWAKHLSKAFYTIFVFFNIVSFDTVTFQAFSEFKPYLRIHNKSLCILSLGIKPCSTPVIGCVTTWTFC